MSVKERVSKKEVSKKEDSKKEEAESLENYTNQIIKDIKIKEKINV